jgi:hypothetical protein
MANELPRSGRQFKSSRDCVTLVNELWNHKQRLEKEINKRGVFSGFTQRHHDLADAIFQIKKRFDKRKFMHYRSEETYIREFGEFLISRHAEVTGTTSKPWEYDDSCLRHQMIVRR